MLNQYGTNQKFRKGCAAVGIIPRPRQDSALVTGLSLARIVRMRTDGGETTGVRPATKTPPRSNYQETGMKKMKKSMHGGRGPLTLGELVTLAYDVTSDRATAAKLLSSLLEGRAVHLRRHMNSGR